MGMPPRRVQPSSGPPPVQTAPQPRFGQRQISGVPVVPSNAAAANAAIGRGIANVGGALIRQQKADERAATTAALSAAKTSVETKLFQAAEESGSDFQAFQTRTAEMRDGFIENLPAAAQQYGGLEFDRLAERFGRQVLGKAYTAQNNRIDAELLDRMERARDEVMAATRAGDAEALEVARGEYFTARQALFDTGRASPEWFVSTGDKLVAGVMRQGVLGEFDIARQGGLASAEAFIEKFEDGGAFAEVKDPDQRAAIVAEMHRSLSDERAEAREAARRAEAAYREQFGQARDSVEIAVKAHMNGMTPADYDSLKAAIEKAAEGDPNYQQLLTVMTEAERYAGTVESAAGMTPPERAALISRRAGQVRTETDIKLVKTLEAVDREFRRAAEENPYAAAARAGHADYQPVVATDPVSLGTTLAARAETRARIESAWNEEIPLITRDEQAAIKDQYEQATGMERMAMTEAIVASLPAGDAQSMFRSLAADMPDIAYQGGMLAAGPQFRGTVEKAMAGRDVEAVTLPQGSATIFADVVGSALYLQDKTRAAVNRMAADIYKTEMSRQGIDPASMDAEDVYERAVQMAMGRTGGEDDYRGGIVTVDGADGPTAIVVPTNMRQADAVEALEKMRPAHLLAAALNGTPPRYPNGDPYDPEKDGAYPVPSGDGLYYLSTTNPAVEAPVFLRGGGRNGLFQFDLNAVDQARQADAAQAEVGPSWWQPVQDAYDDFATALTATAAPRTMGTGRSVKIEPMTDQALTDQILADMTEGQREAFRAEQARRQSGQRTYTPRQELRPMDWTFGLEVRTWEDMAKEDNLIGYAATILKNGDVKPSEVRRFTGRDDLIGYSARLIEAARKAAQELAKPGEASTAGQMGRNRGQR